MRDLGSPFVVQAVAGSNPVVHPFLEVPDSTDQGTVCSTPHALTASLLGLEKIVDGLFERRKIALHDFKHLMDVDSEVLMGD